MADNLIVNGGFETGDFTGWTASGTPDNLGVDSVPEDVYSGNYGVYAGNDSAGLSQTITTVPGDIYSVSFYLDVYQADATDGSMDVTFGGQTVVDLTEPAETDQNSDPFTLYSADIVAASTSSTLDFQFSDPPGYFGLDDVSVTDDGVPCYVRGTRIATPEGSVCVEKLQVGALVLAASGEPRPVRWLGHRSVDCRRYREPSSIWPVCIQKGAFADDQPSRDLWISPGHSILINGALIQAKNLVNGTTVAQVPLSRVQYWHVELDSHDILLAEGLPAESYLDTGNRTSFIHGGACLEALPDFGPKRWNDTCVPLQLEGPQIAAAKALLLARAKLVGFEMTTYADPHIVLGNQRIDAIKLSETRYGFLLPTTDSTPELRSRTFIPAHVDALSNDGRLLGISVSRLQLDGVEVALTDESIFGAAWHGLEAGPDGPPFRWSRGNVPIPAGTRFLMLDLRNRGHYWNSPSKELVAMSV